MNMIREIIHDIAMLSIPAEPADESDIAVADDLQDTLKANREICVGLAANMIGVNKAIIVCVDTDTGEQFEMFNPVILKKSSAYEAEEGCLSLEGTRKTARYHKILVQWDDRNMESHTQAFFNVTAQIILHETDRCQGILI